MGVVVGGIHGLGEVLQRLACLSDESWTRVVVGGALPVQALYPHGAAHCLEHGVCVFGGRG